MARNKSCHSPLEARLEVRQDTMPVRPSEDPIRESLSHHGETEALMDLEVTEGEVEADMRHDLPDETQREMEEGGSRDEAEEEDEVTEARVARGKKSPKDPTKKEKSMNSHTCPFGAGVRTA